MDVYFLTYAVLKHVCLNILIISLNKDLRTAIRRLMQLVYHCIADECAKNETGQGWAGGHYNVSSWEFLFPFQFLFPFPFPGAWQYIFLCSNNNKLLWLCEDWRRTICVAAYQESSNECHIAKCWCNSSLLSLSKHNPRPSTKWLQCQPIREAFRHKTHLF